MDPKFRALMAGEPRWNTPDSGSGDSAASGDDGAGDNPSGDQDLFNKGFGKGTEKGRKEGVSAVLRELGVSSVDEAKSIAAKAAKADEAARKAAEEQGNFKSLYEEQAQLVEGLKARAAIADRYEAAQKQELDTITEKLSDEDKAAIDGLPLDRALALAKRLSAVATKGVGAGPAGNGGEPGKVGGKDLAYYERKGYANLTPEERADADRLEREKYGSITIGQVVEAQVMRQPGQ